MEDRGLRIKCVDNQTLDAEDTLTLEKIYIVLD